MKGLLNLALAFVLCAVTVPALGAAQSGSPIEGFNRAMSEAGRRAPGVDRLEAVVDALRANMAIGEITVRVIGSHQGAFTDDQLRRLSRAILYKFAGDLLAASGGSEVFLEGQRFARERSAQDSIEVLIEVPGAFGGATSARIVTGTDTRGDVKIFDLEMDGLSVVGAEAQAFSDTMNMSEGNAELVVQSYESMAETAPVIVGDGLGE